MISSKIIAQENFELGESALISVEITNNSDGDISLLQWNTPLEGFYCSLLEITDSDGKTIPYEGIMVKRGNPKAKHFIKIKSGETVEAHLDFSEVYKVQKSGRYKIQLKFRTKLTQGKKSELIYSESNILEVNFN